MSPRLGPRRHTGAFPPKRQPVYGVRPLDNLRSRFVLALASQVPRVGFPNEIRPLQWRHRSAFERNRCVIPASGYYEWKPTRNGKQPYYISARDGAILSFAGLWDEWHDIEIGETIRSCAIIVTGANALTRPVHEQMPAVLKRFEPWLAGVAGAEVLKPAPEDMLQMWPVSRRVNRVGHDADRTLIEAVQ